MKIRTLMLTSFVITLMCTCAAPLMAMGSPWYINFESGTDWSAVQIPGITFSDGIVYAERGQDWRIIPEDGDTGEYWVDGNFGIAGTWEDLSVISFQNAISDFKIGYSSFFDIVAEAYNADNELVATVTGLANSKGNNGSGLGTLQLSGLGITSVRLYTDQKQASAQDNEAGWYLLDDMTATASVVPEPATVLAALSILAPAGMLFRRSRKIE